jgi:hypothetical protein
MISFAGGMAAASGRQSGWRPVLTLGPANSETDLHQFVVTGPGNAWSIWIDCVGCGGQAAEQQHA